MRSSSGVPCPQSSDRKPGSRTATRGRITHVLRRLKRSSHETVSSSQSLRLLPSGRERLSRAVDTVEVPHGRGLPAVIEIVDGVSSLLDQTLLLAEWRRTIR